MAKENFQITYVDKGRPGFDEVQKKLGQLHKLKQEIDDDLTLMTDHVELNVQFDGPARIIPISDTHLFAVQTDLEKVNELIGKIKEPNSYGIIMGDFIEGANPKIVDHINNVEIGFTNQIRAAKKIIEPYVQTGKILCMVGTYMGHEGWGDSNLGIDVVQLIADGFKQPDGTDLRVLYNGGRLIIHLKNGVTFTELIYHAPGGGGSDEINPLGAQRERLKEYVTKYGPVDGAGGGDWHHRAGVSKELGFDANKEKDRSRVFFANGTTKGNDPNRPDTFLTKMAKGPTIAPGVQLIFNQPKRSLGDGRDGEQVWVSYGFNKGEILYEAAKLLDKSEKKNKTERFVSEIFSRSRKPRPEFERRASRTETKESRFDIPVFEKFTWNIENSNTLPSLVFLLGNIRYGSTTFEKRDREKFVEILKQVDKNPFTYVLGLRHFVGFKTPKEDNRTEILDEIASDFISIARQKKFFGLMLSGSFLDDGWKQKDEHDPVKGRPGDYLYGKLEKNTPLYLNKALMYLNLGNVQYSFLMLDHLDHFGSAIDPFRGLVQARRSIETQVDIVAGGHMPKSGVMTTPDAVYVAPGWFSNYESKGKSNKYRVALGGQAVVLLPNTKTVLPAATFLEAIDIHKAVTLLKGLSKGEKESLIK